MEEKTFNYSVSNRIFNEKIEDGLFKTIYNSMIPIKSTLENFSKLILKPDAHSWCGGIFSGLISDNNWIESSIIGMDFDKGKITLEQVYSKFNEFAIIPNLHYDTFSSSEHLHKFRVVLFFDSPITCIKVYKKIMRTLENSRRVFTVGIRVE